MAVWSSVLMVVAVFPVVYVLYNVVVAYLDLRRRSKLINKAPGREPHFLWGNLREVFLNLV